MKGIALAKAVKPGIRRAPIEYRRSPERPETSASYIASPEALEAGKTPTAAHVPSPNDCSENMYVIQ